MSESLAVVGSIALFGPDGWFDHVVGWPQGAEVDGSGDTGDSRWPSPLDVADDPQLAEWRRLKELADAEDEWKPNVEGEVASPVRLRQPNGKLKRTGAKTFQFFYPASVLVSLGCLSMSALYWYIVIEAQKTTAKAELSDRRAGGLIYYAVSIVTQLTYTVVKPPKVLSMTKDAVRKRRNRDAKKSRLAPENDQNEEEEEEEEEPTPQAKRQMTGATPTYTQGNITIIGSIYRCSVPLSR